MVVVLVSFVGEERVKERDSEGRGAGVWARDEGGEGRGRRRGWVGRGTKS